MLRGVKPATMEQPNFEEKQEIEEFPEDVEKEFSASEDNPEDISKNKKKSRPRRSVAEIRTETTAKGAVFLDFKIPSGHKSVKWQTEWKAVAKYGFFVTSDGCIMPYEYYRKTTVAGDGLSGHIRAAHFFFQQDPDRRQRINQYGWPEAEEVSHLCHNPDCCNPLHLYIEARWKNWKRTYCGIKGTCDCGMQPPCVRTYTNPEVIKPQYVYETEIPKVKVILAELHKMYDFVIKPKAVFVAEDQKSKNRQKRRKNQKVHEEQHKKKQAKKAKTQ